MLNGCVCVPCSFTTVKYLFGQVVVHDEGMSSVIPEELSHGTARVRCQVLQRRRIRSCRRHHDGVLHGVGVGQSLDNLRHRRPFLPDRDVDAVELCLLVLTVVETLLIDDGVDGHRRLATNPVTDTHMHTTVQQPVVWDYLREPVPGETFTNSHPC